LEGSRSTEGLNLLTIKGVAKMRKDSNRQKTEGCEQLKLFTSKIEPAVSPTSGTGKVNGPGVELFSRLGQQRALTETILERIVDYGNLDKAYRQVRSNQGSSGVDGMEVEDLRHWLGKNIKELQTSVLQEQYRPSAVRKVEIPKPNGGVRMLGIPTVKDRLVQQAIHQELNRWYEPHFSDHSYGFRPGRNAGQAILQASRYIAEGKEWVVDIDLEKFFDTINQDRLMQRLSKGIGDKRLLRLINAYLSTGIMTNGLLEQRIAGTPQGSPLSPLLSNIVLDELDRELEERGLSFCRYADDCNIFVGSRKAGERVLASLTGFIEGKLKLKVNREKSGVRHCSDVKFLGYTVLPEGKIRVADKSIDRLKSKVRELTKRNRGVKLEQIVKELNAVITGWANYFHLANSWLSDIRSLDSWIRRKLRCYRLKQCGRKYTIYKFLHSLGIPEKRSWNVVMYSQGWWAMSDKVAVNQAMNLLWFAQQGLQSLLARMER
jgi:RNA-directed DNA polymerase